MLPGTKNGPSGGAQLGPGQRPTVGRAEDDPPLGLAVHYREGLGVARDDARANELFEAAARQGLVQAQINLGLRLLEGTGSPADPVRGFAWLEKAASSGSAEAIRRRDYHARGLDEQQRTDAEALARTL